MHFFVASAFRGLIVNDSQIPAITDGCYDLWQGRRLLESTCNRVPNYMNM